MLKSNKIHAHSIQTSKFSYLENFQFKKKKFNYRESFKFDRTSAFRVKIRNNNFKRKKIKTANQMIKYHR